MPAVAQPKHPSTNCKLRKQELRRLKKELPTATYQEVGHGMHWVLRHNYAHLNDDDKVRLRCLFLHSPRLHQAYSLREELTAIFNMKLSLADGRRRLEKWADKVQRSTLTCFDKFLKTLHNYLTKSPTILTSEPAVGLSKELTTN
ncbi:MAG: transposase [bacterium]|nr:transposase [bacterium]